MRTNVAPPAFPNTGGRVMEVTESFECYVEVGITESNTYFGSSQALGRVWQRFTLVPGDQIAAYWSGLVHILVGEYLRPAQYTLSAKHPFEKEYGGGPIDKWPAMLEAQGVTQAELARNMGVSAKHVNQMVGGKAGALGMFDFAAFTLGCQWELSLEPMEVSG